MKSRIFLFFLGALLRTAFAADKVIDLGTDEVHGKNRNPHVSIVESQKKIEDFLPAAFRNQFLRYEKEKLKPAAIDLKKSDTGE